MTQELQIKKFDFNLIGPSASILIVGNKPNVKKELVRQILKSKYEKLQKILVLADETDYSHLNINIQTNYPLPESNDEYRFEQHDKWSIPTVNKYSDSDCIVVDQTTNYSYPSINYTDLDQNHCLKIVCLKDYCGLSYSVRSTIDFIFVLSDVSNLRQFWMESCGIIPKFKILSKLVESCTKEQEYLTIYKSCDGTEVSDCVFWGSVQRSNDGSDEGSDEGSFEGSDEVSDESKSEIKTKKADDCIIL
jgi:hypothetical protein